MVKPMLFNTEMVRAILDGRKTQTRRVIKPVALGLTYENESPAREPPYEPGDYIWVRETWAELKLMNGSKRYVYRASDAYPFGEKYIVKFRWHPSIHMPKEAARIFLRVTNVRV